MEVKSLRVWTVSAWDHKTQKMFECNVVANSVFEAVSNACALYKHEYNEDMNRAGIEKVQLLLSAGYFQHESGVAN